MNRKLQFLNKTEVFELRTFLKLWSTQSLSQLGSAMTSFALTLWLYDKTGSALQTALLSICSYAPYVIMSIFAGALSDRWDKKKVMLVCDTLAACSTICIFILLKAGLLCPAYLYLLNALNGLMNTVQQPASDVAQTVIIPRKHFQKTSGMRSFSQSMITIIHPILATVLYGFGGMELVIGVDLCTFIIAFLTLWIGIKIPKIEQPLEKKESLFKAAGTGLQFLREHPLILWLILFLAGINLVASAFNAVMPALILPRANGGDQVLGIVLSFAGIATLLGSLIVTALPAPKNRVRVIIITMLISLSTENFLLAFAREPVFWCLSQIIGWLPVPLMGANMDVILRTTIPANMQGRVYSCRNTLQFFTIPVGFFLGGLMVDKVCEPFMSAATEGSLFKLLFGAGKGSGAAMMMFILGLAGTTICLIFGQILKKYHFHDSDGSITCEDKPNKNVIQFRKAEIEDLPVIFHMIKDAIGKMEQDGIHQWDDLYPDYDILKEDIEKQQMEVGFDINASKIAVIYVLNQECDEEYQNGKWSNEEFVVIHRLCVNPYMQHAGIARRTMQHILEQFQEDKADTQKSNTKKAIRLDVFSNNPYALKLYNHLGFHKTGEVTWRKGLFYLMEKEVNL